MNEEEETSTTIEHEKGGQGLFNGGTANVKKITYEENIRAEDRRGELYPNPGVRCRISQWLVCCVGGMDQGLAVSENVAKCAQRPQPITSKRVHLPISLHDCCMLRRGSQVSTANNVPSQQKT